MLDRETWLVSTMIELADTCYGDDFDEAAYATGLAGRLASLLAPAEIGVLITADAVSRAPTESIVAGSSIRATDLVRWETLHPGGPCTRCRQTGDPVRDMSLTAQAPWPLFAAAARSAGFGIVSAVPVRHRDQTIGAVSILGDRGHRLTAEDASLARSLAEAAAIGIQQRRALRGSMRTAAQLQHALDSRVVIEQAKGAVAAWLGVKPGDAFELLRAYSRRTSRRLADVAGEIIRRELPAQKLLGHGVRRLPAQPGGTRA
jgi:hypothetical protein